MSKLATDSTVGDLYRHLDWSQAETAAMETMGDTEFAVHPDFKRRYRLTLLDEGLFGAGARRDAARTLLASIGVWSQVVNLLPRT